MIVDTVFSKLPESTKTNVDVATIALTITTVLDLLPSIAAVLSIIWWLLRIWETETVKRRTGRWKDEDKSEGS